MNIRKINEKRIEFSEKVLSKQDIKNVLSESDIGPSYHEVVFKSLIDTNNIIKNGKGRYQFGNSPIYQDIVLNAIEKQKKYKREYMRSYKK